MPSSRAGEGRGDLIDPPRRGLALAASGLAVLTLAASSSLAPVPMLVLDQPPAFPLGPTEPGGYQRHSWSIRNAGPTPVKLRTHFTSGHCGFSLWLGEDRILAPGSSTIVSLSCPTPTRAAASYSAHADVRTSDPARPVVRFRLYGRSGPTS